MHINNITNDIYIICIIVKEDLIDDIFLLAIYILVR